MRLKPPPAPGADLSAAARQQASQLFLRNLGAFLLLDLLIFLLVGLTRHWTILLAAEAALLALSLKHSTDLMRRVLTPLHALEETADALGGDQVDTDSLRRLAARLDEINVGSLKTSRVQLSDENDALAALAGAINAMLERIDRGYQAQARFVSDASHELRTPIAVIQGYANMLDRWGKDDPEVRQEAINAIRAEAASMEALVEQLLFLARGDNNTQAVEMQSLDLSRLADAVYRETCLLETGRTISGDIAPGLFCWGDPGLIKQAVRVLVDNAVKYTPEGGAVTIRLAPAGNQLVLSVTDTGPGIAPEELPRIFERFYRSDQSRARETGGTGLGLPIAAWIAARHGGSIRVTSAEGVGTRFSLLLPAPEPEQAPPEESADTEIHRE
jgi:signal transduction histidine kinase